MPNNKLTIVIVNHNQKKYTDQLLRDLNNQNNKNFRLRLINNGCRENELSFLTDSELICDYHSTSFYGDNMDLNWIWNDEADICSTEYICFLNNDVEITENFVDDTIKILDTYNDVDIVIHSTNNLICNKPTKLSCIGLPQPLYQGWDFTIRKDKYPHIPDSLRIFGGDNYIFAKVVKNGGKVILCTSSPIIHHKEITRNIVSRINDIQKSDASEFYRILMEEDLQIVPSTTTTPYCNRYVPSMMNLIKEFNNVKD